MKHLTFPDSELNSSSKIIKIMLQTITNLHRSRSEYFVSHQHAPKINRQSAGYSCDRFLSLPCILEQSTIHHCGMGIITNPCPCGLNQHTTKRRLARFNQRPLSSFLTALSHPRGKPGITSNLSVFCESSRLIHLCKKFYGGLGAYSRMCF